LRQKKWKQVFEASELLLRHFLQSFLSGHFILSTRHFVSRHFANPNAPSPAFMFIIFCLRKEMRALCNNGMKQELKVINILHE
jgi:hypothetical protein